MLVALSGLATFVVTTATASTSKKAANIDVCVLLPDTKSSVRWVQFDAPDFAKALKAAGVTYSITNALNDPLKQKAQAQSCLARGAKVVVETALDNGSAASIEKLFTSKGGKAIDYDRQVTGGSASVYVTFDGKKVGQAQASGVIAAMKANGTYKKGAVVAELWGGQTDQNAFWFKSGNDAVLNKLFANGSLAKGPQQFVPDWDANNAATIFNQMLVKTNNNIQGIIAANDNIAGAVVADLKAKGLKPLPLSGQDATPQGLQYIISGWQTMTVWKDTRVLAKAAAAEAVDLLKGKPLKTTGTVPNGAKKEPAFIIPPVMLTKSNWTQIYKSGFIKKSDVCNGSFAKYCK